MLCVFFQMNQMYAPQYDPQRNGGQVNLIKLKSSYSNMASPQIYPAYAAGMYSSMYHRWSKAKGGQNHYN